jgi:MFS superfamily sulfate permease-like transporter
MLIASSVNGFLFGFVSGQPLLILGPTGPFLVFEEMVYDVSEIRMIMKYKSIYLAMSIIERRFLDSPMLC